LFGIEALRVAKWMDHSQGSSRRSNALTMNGIARVFVLDTRTGFLGLSLLLPDVPEVYPRDGVGVDQETQPRAKFKSKTALSAKYLTSIIQTILKY